MNAIACFAQCSLVVVTTLRDGSALWWSGGWIDLLRYSCGSSLSGESEDLCVVHSKLLASTQSHCGRLRSTSSQQDSIASGAIHVTGTVFKDQTGRRNVKMEFEAQATSIAPDATTI